MAVSQSLVIILKMKTIIFILLIGVLICCTHNKQDNIDFYSKQIKIIDYKIALRMNDFQEYSTKNKTKVQYFFNEANNLRSFIKENFYSELFSENYNISADSLKEKLLLLRKEILIYEYGNKTLFNKRFHDWLEKNNENLKWTLEEQYKLLFELKNTELDYIDACFHLIDHAEFKFNMISGTVMDSSNVINVNEFYYANIFLSAIDTTKYYEVLIGDYELDDLYNGNFNEDSMTLIPVNNYGGIYRKKYTKPGKYYLRGLIKYFCPSSKSDYLYFPFQTEFVVKE